MTIKSILCIFGGLQSELNALSTALVLGKAHAAQIRMLHVSSEPSAYVGLYGEGVFVSGEIIAAVEKENKERLNKAKQYVTSFAAKHHVPLDQPDAPAHHASARFTHLVGLVDATIAREGRISDLIVLGGVDDKATHDYITPALFDTGRPVLVMPPTHGDMPRDWNDKTVAVAWDGSLQASRALYNALPLIRNAEKVIVLTAQETGKAFDLEAECGIMGYLRAHGIHGQGIVVATGQRALPESLLARAKDLKADLMVMGAYGHSQFREMILGGVTEHMLQKADIPLLLSH